MLHTSSTPIIFNSTPSEANIRRNRGELAEGWYDPSTRQKALESSTTASQSISRRRSSPSYGDSIQKREQTLSNSEDDGPGPSLPDNPRQSRHGPAIPTMQDLELKRGILHPPFRERSASNKS